MKANGHKMIFTFEKTGRKHVFDFDGRIFSVCLEKGGQEQWIDSTEFVLQEFSIQESLGATASYLYGSGGQGVEIMLEQRVENDEVLSLIKVVNNIGHTVRAVKYPLEALDHVATYDSLLMASSWGDKIDRPTKTISDVCTSESVKFEQDYIVYRPNEVIYTYPSIMSMQYMTLYNDSRTVYMATYSTADESMTFHARVLGRYELELSVNHYPFLDTGEWTSPPCGFAMLDGGWHKAARLYASHMSGCFKTPEYPAWMKNEYHGWLELVMKREGKPPVFTYDELPSKYRYYKEHFGINHIFLVGWHDNGHDTKFPRYLPCEEAGTAGELIAAIEQIHRDGGRVSLYTNARIVDVYEKYYSNGGKNAVCLDENGKEYRENYHTASLYAIACPGEDEYVTHMTGVADRIAGEYHADGMFVDQISCNLAVFCYSKVHHHARPSCNFLPGVTRELISMREAGKALNPDFHSFSEGCHERFNQYYDVNQGHGEEYTWQIGESVPEQFLFTYPDRIVTGHCADMHQLYHSMAQFKPLDIKDSLHDDPHSAPIIKTYMQLRRSYPQYFLQGEFLDDEPFTCDKGHRLYAMQAADGSICFCVWRKGADQDTVCNAIVGLPGEFALDTVIYPQGTSLTRQGELCVIGFMGPLCFITIRKG